MVKKKNWSKLPKENNFLDVPLSEFQSLSPVPVCIVSMDDRKKGGFTEGKKIRLNKNVCLQYIRGQAPKILKKHKDGEKATEYFLNNICSKRDLVYFIFLHELAHIELEHPKQKAEIERLKQSSPVDCMGKINEKLSQIFGEVDIDKFRKFKEAMEVEANYWSVFKLKEIKTQSSS